VTSQARKRGKTVPQQRLVIDLSEVLYLEIYCDTCKNLAVLPLEDQPGVQFGTNRYVSLYACPSCQKPFTKGSEFKTAIESLREVFKSHRDTQGEFAIRLVIQQ
jgi:hypothetical protein